MTTLPEPSLDSALTAPLYQQLYAHLRAAILSGELKGAMKLPSTRALADELNVSRNTVLNAYRQLTVEGYLESDKGSGTFVARVLPDSLLMTPAGKVSTAARPREAEPTQPLFSKHAARQLALLLITQLSRKNSSLQNQIRSITLRPPPSLWLHSQPGRGSSNTVS